MKHMPPFAAVLTVIMFAGPATAACIAEYKAKQDNPLRLDFGRATLSDSACDSKKAAEAELRPLLDQQGWKLLAVTSLTRED